MSRMVGPCIRGQLTSLNKQKGKVTNNSNKLLYYNREPYAYLQNPFPSKLNVNNICNFIFNNTNRFWALCNKRTPIDENMMCGHLIETIAVWECVILLQIMQLLHNMRGRFINIEVHDLKQIRGRVHLNLA